MQQEKWSIPSSQYSRQLLIVQVPGLAVWPSGGDRNGDLSILFGSLLPVSLPLPPPEKSDSSPQRHVQAQGEGQEQD